MKKKGQLEDMHDAKSVKTDNTNFDISDYSVSEIQPDKSQNRSNNFFNKFKKRTLQDQQEIIPDDDREVSFQEKSYNIGKGKAKRMGEKVLDKSDQPDVSNNSSNEDEADLHKKFEKSKLKQQDSQKFKSRYVKKNYEEDEKEDEEQDSKQMSSGKSENNDDEEDDQDVVFKNDFKGKHRFQASIVQQKNRDNSSSIKDITPSNNNINFYSQNSQTGKKLNNIEEDKEDDIFAEPYNPFITNEKLQKQNTGGKKRDPLAFKKADSRFAKKKDDKLESTDEKLKKDDSLDQQATDTNPENQKLDYDYKGRPSDKMGAKTEEFFDFTNEKLNEDQLIEEGLPLDDLIVMQNYYSLPYESRIKKSKSKARKIFIMNRFYTSRCFMLFHLTQNVIFWLVVIIFPIISVQGCINGHWFMSHVAVGIFLGFCFMFDFVFANQFQRKQLLMFDLRQKRYNKRLGDSKCCFRLNLFVEAIFELVMTYIGLLDIYCDIAFATIVRVENMETLYAISVTSIVLIVLPKIYAMFMTIIMMFSCDKDQNRRRKHIFRILTFDEYRVQALNLEYVDYEKQRFELIMGFYKFLIEDLPQFIIQTYYLSQTDCGIKNANTIVYLSVILAVLNTYFNLIYRLLAFWYSYKRLRGYIYKLQVKITNSELAKFGLNNIIGKTKANRKAQSVMYSGDHFQYLPVTTHTVQKFVKLVDNFEKIKENIEFLDLVRLDIQDIEIEKKMFDEVNDKFKQLRYFQMSECKLCKNFILQLRPFIDRNESLVRITFAMNGMKEIDVIETMESCFNHPNLEVLQIAEQESNYQQATKTDDKNDKTQNQEEENLNARRMNKVSMSKRVQILLTANQSLKKLEIRFFVLSRQFIQAIFRGIGKNNTLQKLLLTHGTLSDGKQSDFKILGDAFQQNYQLLVVDISNNLNLDQNLTLHYPITDGLLKASSSKLERLYVTSNLKEVKEHYLELMDQKRDILIFCNDKILEDIDIQEK